MKRKLCIAIQNKGRLMEPSLKFLKDKGLKFDDSVFYEDERKLCVECFGSEFELLFVRCNDIPTYIERGAADFGIVGENLLYEKCCKLPVLQKLDFGICSLVIAVPENSEICSAEDLNGERIATSYPYSLKQYLQKKKINAAIIEIQGSVEIAPKLNLADAICDITQTGKTLKSNGLKIIDTVLNSQAVLISSPEFVKEAKNYEKILFTKIG